MKVVLNTLIISLVVKIVTSTLQLEVLRRPRCFIEDFYVNGVAVIKWKLVALDGFPKEPERLGKIIPFNP